MNDELQRYREQQAKAYLREIRELFIHVKALEAEIESQRELATGLTGVDYSKPGAGQAAGRDAVPNAVARLIELTTRACMELEACVAMQDEARRCLEEMGGVEADVLKLRYVAAKPWKDVSLALGYSVPYVKELCKDGLFCFYDYMPAHRRDPRIGAI